MHSGNEERAVSSRGAHSAATPSESERSDASDGVAPLERARVGDGARIVTLNDGIPTHACLKQQLLLPIQSGRVECSLAHR